MLQMHSMCLGDSDTSVSMWRVASHACSFPKFTKVYKSKRGQYKTQKKFCQSIVKLSKPPELFEIVKGKIPDK